MKATFSAALAAALLIGGAALAQTMGEPANQTADQNQKATQQYNNMVGSNAGFRNSRMHKECDPIEAPDLKQQCMSSFGNSPSSMGTMGSGAGSRSTGTATQRR
jgi:hypothetical protein